MRHLPGFKVVSSPQTNHFVVVTTWAQKGARGREIGQMPANDKVCLFHSEQKRKTSGE